MAGRGVDGHRDIARFAAVHAAERGELLPELERTRARRFVDRVVIARGGDGEAVGRVPLGKPSPGPQFHDPIAWRAMR